MLSRPRTRCTEGCRARRRQRTMRRSYLLAHPSSQTRRRAVQASGHIRRERCSSTAQSWQTFIGAILTCHDREVRPRSECGDRRSGACLAERDRDRGTSRRIESMFVAHCRVNFMRKYCLFQETNDKKRTSVRLTISTNHHRWSSSNPYQQDCFSFDPSAASGIE